MVTRFFPDEIRPYFDCEGVDELGSPLYSTSPSCSFVNPLSTQKCVNNSRSNLLVSPYTGVCQEFDISQAPLTYGNILSFKILTSFLLSL